MTTESDFLASLHADPASEEHALEVLNGPEDGRLIALEGLENAIGRLETSDVVFGLDRTISRTHARITHAAGGNYFIEDMGSLHGTYVNEQKLEQKAQLKDGDTILVGATLLLFRQGEGRQNADE